MNRLALTPSIGYITPIALVLLGTYLLQLPFIRHKNPPDPCAAIREKDARILALTNETDSLRKQISDINSSDVNCQPGGMDARINALKGENERLRLEVLNLGTRYGELHTKAYANLLALANGNKALQDQLELTISIYADEISKLKTSLRKAEAERDWVESQVQTIQRAKEDLEANQSDEVLELRDKLHEYNRRLQDRASGGGLPDPLSRFNLATLCDSRREPRAHGSSGDSSPV